MKPVIFLLAILALAAQAAPAAADGPTTGQFLTDCSKPENRDACVDLLSEWELDNSAPCPAQLDLVLANLRRHPEWSDRPWTEGVTSALAEVCRK